MRNSLWLCALTALFTVVLSLSCSAADKTASISIPYSLPRDGQISLLIKDARGKVVRELLHAAPRKKGANSEVWDGLDERGQPVAAGEYSWKLLSTQGLCAEYLISLGTNPAEPWESWPGNHNGVWGVAQDESGVLFAGAGEGTPPIIKQSFAEKRLWTVPNWLEAWQGGVDVSIADGTVFMLQGNGRVWLLDAKTGVPKTPAPIDIIWEEKDRDYTSGYGATRVLDTDARGDQFVAAYTNHNAIRWLNPADGKVIDEVAVLEPLGIALAPDKQVLALSRGSVISLSRTDKTPKTLISGLTSPWRLAVDQKNGDIFIAERGASQQVKKFSKKGKLLKTYGPRGGRKLEGHYNPMAFRDITNITADGAGGFYTCEQDLAPRRTGHFDARGELLREWYGGQMYANFASADPGDPSLVWIDSDWGELILAKVDYARKSWKVQGTYIFGGLANGLVKSTFHGAGRWYPLRRNNQTYLVREGWQSLTILRFDEKKDRLIPILHADQNISADFALKMEDSPALKAIFDATRGDAKAFIWADINGDEHLQKEEIKYADYTRILSAYSKKIAGEKLPSWSTPGKDKEVLDLLLWAATGRPHFFNVGAPLDPLPADMTEADNRTAVYWWVDEKGNRFYQRNTEGDKPFGVGFWGARVGGNRVLKFDKNGKLLWQVGRHAAGSHAKPGEAKYFWRMVGSVHGCIAIGDPDDFATHVWDEDGLWVGRLLDNPDLKSAPSTAFKNQNPMENFGGSLYQNPRTGEVLFFASGTNNSPVYRIHGWDQFQRQNGRISVSEKTASDLEATVRAEASRTDVARIVRSREIQLDGELGDWKDVTPVEIKNGDETVSRVYLSWNTLAGDPSIFAAFDVTTSTPWKTAATPQLAFQGGASVEVRMGPLEPGRREAGPLDVRLVASPLNGANAGVSSVIEFAPKREFVANSHANWSPYARTSATYQTGNGKITFNRVGLLAWENQIFAFAKPKADNRGYIVEMRIPMSGIIAPLPLEARAGTRFRFDAGVTLANREGNRAQTRLNWHSKVAEDMTTQDVYIESLLRPQNWGYAELE